MLVLNLFDVDVRQRDIYEQQVPSASRPAIWGAPSCARSGPPTANSSSSHIGHRPDRGPEKQRSGGQALPHDPNREDRSRAEGVLEAGKAAAIHEELSSRMEGRGEAIMSLRITSAGLRARWITTVGLQRERNPSLSCGVRSLRERPRRRCRRRHHGARSSFFEYRRDHHHDRAARPRRPCTDVLHPNSAELQQGDAVRWAVSKKA